MGHNGFFRNFSLAVRAVVVVALFASSLFAQAKPERQSKAAKAATAAPASQPAAAASGDTDATKAEDSKPEEKAFKGMHYRMIGPFRGGRSLTAAGIPGDPTTYYFGSTGGGVWKSTDGAMTWSSVFDKEGTSSIGSIAVASSNHNVIYVGTGEACIRGNISHGDGVYRSLDGGKTWKNTGLRDSRAIGKVIVNPTNPDIAFVAALGHPYGPNTERGIFRTIDGGKTWEKVLYKNENTGAIQVAIDPKNPNNVFADLWAGRQGPWENGAWQGPESGLFKSADGGTTWKKIKTGLPAATDGLGRIGFCIAASNPQRMYACVDAAKGGGVYKSNDGGE